MKKGLVIGLVILIVFVLIFAWGGSTYNSFVSAREGVNSAWSQVENVYQRRSDLIPNLVETVKGYASQEERVFREVTEARSRVGSIQMTPQMLDNPQQFQKFQQAQGELSSALSRLLVVAENYPQLKSNENFLQLQQQLEGTENRITVERQRFIQVAQDYNIRIKRFPAALVAGLTGFREKAYFEAERGANEAPKVKFDFPK
jgi:LemA protein